MTKLQKIMEQHKRAARRNFLAASKHEQEKIREKYKPANLHGVIKLKEKSNKKQNLEGSIESFNEVDFRMKIQESVNKLYMKEKGRPERIYYSQANRRRRHEKPRDKAISMLRNCR